MKPDLITQTLFVTGRLLHQGTGRPPEGEVEITALEGPVVGRALADGTFVVSGDLPRLFPELKQRAYGLNLLIRVVSRQFIRGYYEGRAKPLTIPQGADFDPDPDLYQPNPPPPPHPPLDAGTIVLSTQYEPIHLRGRVVAANDPEAPIAGATLTLFHNGVETHTTTGADGCYRFPEITDITDPVTLRAVAAGYNQDKDRLLVLDFTRTVNQEDFQLKK